MKQIFVSVFLCASCVKSNIVYSSVLSLLCFALSVFVFFLCIMVAYFDIARWSVQCYFVKVLNDEAVIESSIVSH